MDDMSEGEISWRERVTQRNPKVPAKARPIRTNQSVKRIDVIEAERI